MSNNDLPKIWCSFDMEMNHKEGTSELEDIIQIGAVAFEFKTGRVIDKLNLFIKLPDQKKVAPFIKTLTGITDEKLNKEGRDSLWLAYLELCEFVSRNDCFKDAVCWGGNDGQYLKAQLIKTSGYSQETHGKFIFNSNYFDAKKYFQAYCMVNDLSMRSGMAKSMTRLGLKFHGRIHSAIDDAINCSTVFHFLCKKFKQ